MFREARNVYQDIKRKMEDNRYAQNVEEFKEALRKLITEYNTANWENRFVVGGALEVLFYALLRSMNFQCRWLHEARYDLEINGVNFSIKSSFTGTGDIRLINILGDERAVWNEPTLFFISELGICYADPDMGLSTRHTSDALVINIRELRNRIEDNDQWVIHVSIPRKPKNSNIIKTASRDVAKSILEEINSQFLRNYLLQI